MRCVVVKLFSKTNEWAKVQFDVDGSNGDGKWTCWQGGTLMGRLGLSGGNWHWTPMPISQLSVGIGGLRNVRLDHLYPATQNVGTKGTGGVYNGPGLFDPKAEDLAWQVVDVKTY